MLSRKNYATRRFAPIVRLEVADGTSPDLIEWLVGEIGIDRQRDVYLSDAPLG